jgi:hypothetical protein
MWAIFLRCSQPRAAELLQQGMRFMSNGADLRRALEAFDQVIVCEPSFAEVGGVPRGGWGAQGYHQKPCISFCTLQQFGGSRVVCMITQPQLVFLFSLQHICSVVQRTMFGLWHPWGQPPCVLGRRID